MGFFEDFDEARYQFTIGDAKKPELNVLQVGLVGIFFLDKAYQRREVIAQALELYAQHYGDKLKWGFFGENMKKRNWDAGIREECLHYIRSESPMEYVNFLWSSSAIGYGYVGDYAIDAVSPAGWYEDVHKPLSYLRFYLPVEELSSDNSALESSLLLPLCNLLRPLHAYFGLGLQNCYEHEDYQHMEYELAQEFRAVDVGHPFVGEKVFRAGFKTINWYTILDQQWIDKLGGADAIRAQLSDERIALLPYSHGLVIRAGEWPELGWIEKTPYPDLYVKVNQALKPVRVPELQGLHYGSVAGEIRFNERTSNEWLRRFDNLPSPKKRPQPKPAKADDSGTVERRSYCPAGQPCPEAGWWFTPAKACSRRYFKQGEVMPSVGGDYGETFWQWSPDQSAPTL